MEEGPPDDVEDMMNVSGGEHMHPLNGPDEQETALRSGRLGRQLTLKPLVEEVKLSNDRPEPCRKASLRDADLGEKVRKP